MATGTVKWFNYKKGYGFVTPDKQGSKDVFIHVTAVNSAGISELKEGQKISYEIELRQGKSSAVNIALV